MMGSARSDNFIYKSHDSHLISISSKFNSPLSNSSDSSRLILEYQRILEIEKTVRPNRCGCFETKFGQLCHNGLADNQNRKNVAGVLDQQKGDDNSDVNSQIETN